MKRIHLLAAALAFAVVCSVQAGRIAYPTADEPSFIIEVPDGWEMTAAQEEGDYFHLDGPTGAVFSFRAIEGTKETLEESIQNSIKNIGEMFADVELGDAQDWTPNGLSGFYATGTAKDKDGTPVRIGVAWCLLNDGKIAEMWFVSDLSDQPGMTAAEGIANSLSAP